MFHIDKTVPLWYSLEWIGLKQLLLRNRGVGLLLIILIKIEALIFGYRLIPVLVTISLMIQLVQIKLIQPSHHQHPRVYS